MKNIKVLGSACVQSRRRSIMWNNTTLV